MRKKSARASFPTDVHCPPYNSYRLYSTVFKLATLDHEIYENYKTIISLKCFMQIKRYNETETYAYMQNDI